jgi:hypothetical protein
MIFTKKMLVCALLFISFVLLYSCNKPPEYFDELKETDLLSHRNSEVEKVNLSSTTFNTEDKNYSKENSIEKLENFVPQDYKLNGNKK